MTMKNDKTSRNYVPIFFFKLDIVVPSPAAPNSPNKANSIDSAASVIRHVASSSLCTFQQCNSALSICVDKRPRHDSLFLRILFLFPFRSVFFLLLCIFF